jgi:cardiolipin synthase
LISFTRLPLAAAFVIVAEQPTWAFVVLLAGGLSDVVDGWWARRFDQATATGAVIDGVTDKLFALAVVTGLLLYYELSLLGVLALAARELFELPLVIWWAFHRAQRKAKAEDPRANWIGKLATVVQFTAVVAIVMHLTWATGALVACGIVGTVAALVYWKRELMTFAGDS